MSKFNTVIKTIEQVKQFDVAIGANGYGCYTFQDRQIILTILSPKIVFYDTGRDCVYSSYMKYFEELLIKE